MTSDAVDQSADNRDGSSTSRSETTSPVVAASIAAQLKTLGHASAPVLADHWLLNHTAKI